jgi:acetoin utilization deacetylase AcuC-like enzyme
MAPLRLVYSDEYDLNLGAHVFPSRKYKLIRDQIVKEGLASPDQFISPAPASDEDLLRVHTEHWVNALKTGTLSAAELRRLEIPYSTQMVRGFWLAAGGTILAAKLALDQAKPGFAISYNVGGGFHHAYPGHGEGFCAIHDVAVAIRHVQAGFVHENHHKIHETAMDCLVVDVDVHQGNGTAAIFAGDPTVYTLSIHHFNNYPAVKPPSTLDIDLEDGAGDEEYLEKLDEGLAKAFASFEAQGLEPKSFMPKILMYVAGADPYREDQLGGLALSIDGLKRRDKLVFETARRHGVPVVVTLAGGYARNVEDTVTIHVNTVKAAMETLSA